MNEYEREIELYDYIEVLLKYKWFILVVTLVCGGLGWVFRPAPPPPLYEADVVLMIKRLPSQQAGDGAQADISAVGQTSGFYQALALADDLKQALIDSLGLEMSLISMDGLLQVQVLDPGIRLSVRSHDRGLPIKLVNAWAKFFVERNGDLNVEEVGSYYEYVKSQYDTTLARLDTTEAKLRRFEAENATSFLEIQRATLDTATISTYRKMIGIGEGIQQMDLELQGIDLLLLSPGRDLYSQLTQDRQQSSTEKTLLAQAYLDSQLKVSLQHFDRKYKVAMVRRQVEFNGIDSLRMKISHLERELKNHKAVLGSEVNPTFAVLSDRLSTMRLEYEFAKPLSVDSTSQTGNMGTRTLDDALTILQRRELIINQHDLVVSDYLKSLSLRDSIVVQKDVFARQREYLGNQIQSIRNSLDSIKKELSTKTQAQQRLLRDRELLSGTVTRFSKLLEEARIVREKAAGDMRVLTRALKVRQVPQEQGQQKAAIAAGVGFLLSSILSLFAEYMRKARQNRSAGTNE